MCVTAVILVSPFIKDDRHYEWVYQGKLLFDMIYDTGDVKYKIQSSDERW
jgi:hypothetical protein